MEALKARCGPHVSLRRLRMSSCVWKTNVRCVRIPSGAPAPTTESDGTISVSIDIDDTESGNEWIRQSGEED
jgi:hypothetical protein